MTSPETAPESLPPGETLGRNAKQLAEDIGAAFAASVGNPPAWRSCVVTLGYVLSHAPPPVSVSVPASKCDRPGQADAAVAEAERYEWRRKVDFDGPGPWYPCDRSWIDHLVGDDLYETRSLYVTSEAVLLAAKPRSEWRPIETAPSGKWVLLNYGEVFASHTGYRQNDGKWVHPENREPVAWMLLPSTKLCPPPVSVPASKCDRPGQADAAVAEAVARAICHSEGHNPDADWNLSDHPAPPPLPAWQTYLPQARAALRATAPGEQSDGWQAGMEAAASIADAVAEAAAYQIGRGVGPWEVREEAARNVAADIRAKLPAPPTAAPSPPVDHAGGQGVRAELAAGLNTVLQQVAAEAGKSPRQVLDEAKAFIRRTPTPAAPAPGREDGDAIAVVEAWFKEFENNPGGVSDEFVGTCQFAARQIVIALARTPARTDGGVVAEAILELHDRWVHDRRCEAGHGPGTFHEGYFNGSIAALSDVTRLVRKLDPQVDNRIAVKQAAARTTPNRAGETP